MNSSIKINIKIAVLSACILVIFYLGITAFQSRFWDSQRIEKLVNAEVRIGSSETEIIEWLAKSRIKYQRLQNIDSSFAHQSAVENSRLDAKQLSSLIAATDYEGTVFDGPYHIKIYFFFDRQGKLIKYDFLKTYQGF